jgi:glycine/D-amino acid oxidase-like deaminating enzyme
VARQRSAGLEVDILEGNSLRVFAPWLGDRVVAASFCDEDSYASPLACGVALRTLLVARGVALCAHAPVLRITRSGTAFSVESAAGTVQARKVLIAAGPWSAAIAATLGVTVPLGADVNMLSATEPGPHMIDRVVTHVDGILSLKQYANGTCLIGGGWQGRGSYQSGAKELDYVNLLHNVRTAIAVLPSLSRLTLLRSWSGFEAVAPDALPVFGRLSGVGDAYIVAGARGAYSQGPALGLEIARLMTEGQTELDLTSFTPARFGA